MAKKKKQLVRRKQPKPWFKNYWLNHLDAAKLGFTQLWHTPWSSLATLLVLAIALALPLGLHSGLKGIKHFNQHWDGDRTITVFVKGRLTGTSPTILLNKIRAIPGVAKATFISEEQALKELKLAVNISENTSLFEHNPLPQLVAVEASKKAQSTEKMQALRTTLEQLDEVEKAELDLDWLEKLYTIVTLVKRTAIILTALFGLSILLIVGNATHAMTQRHQQHIDIYHFLGASRPFIRRPFLYSGLFYGFFAAGLAWIVLTVSLIWLIPALQQLAESYGLAISWQHTIPFHYLLPLLGFGLVLGYLGSRLSLRKRI